MEETGSAGATHESTGNVTDNNELVTISRNARSRRLQVKSCAFCKKALRVQRLVQNRTTFSGRTPNYHCQGTQAGQLTKANKVD